mgnify:FL=1
MLTVNLYTYMTYDIVKMGSAAIKIQITLVAYEESGIGHWKIRTGITIIKTNENNI